MKVAVVGTGIMGRGIAQVCIENGFSTVFYNPRQESLEVAKEMLRKDLVKKIEKKSIDININQLLSNLLPTTNLSELGQVDIVIESVNEDFEVKKEVWLQIGEVVTQSTLLTTNTSSLSVSKIALACNIERQMCGLHFFNPVRMMPLIELVTTEYVDEEMIELAANFAEGLGKTPIKCSDTPGFIVNRLLIPYINHAILLLDDSQLSPLEIDDALKLGASMPIGPLALADLIGLDIVKSIMDNLYLTTNESRFKAAPTLVRLVEDGNLGRKTTQGFYEYI